MLFGPSTPTVASVARMWKVDKLWTDPSGKVIVAVVLGGKISVAWRKPISSEEMVPCATWVAEEPLEITVTAGSGGIITTSGRTVYSCQVGVTGRWTEKRSLRS